MPKPKNAAATNAAVHARLKQILHHKNLILADCMHPDDRRMLSRQITAIEVVIEMLEAKVWLP